MNEIAKKYEDLFCQVEVANTASVDAIHRLRH